MGFRRILEYLVIEAMVDKRVVKAILDYFDDGEFGSLATIAARYGLSKSSLRGSITRLMEKEPRHARLGAYVRLFAPIVLKIVPTIVVIDGSYATCTICKTKIPCAKRWRASMISHVRTYHSGMIENLVEKALDEAIRVVKKGFSSR